MVTAGVGVAGGRPPVTEGVGERTTFANKAVTNGGRIPLSPALVVCVEGLSGEGSGRRRRPHPPPCAGRVGCGDWPGCRLP